MIFVLPSVPKRIDKTSQAPEQRRAIGHKSSLPRVVEICRNELKAPLKTPVLLSFLTI